MSRFRDKVEVIWIGPSKCDELRAERESRLTEVWNIIISCKRFKDMYSIIVSSIDLFREALSCYQNGAFMATIIMCGVALESLLYDVISTIKGEVAYNEQESIWYFETNYEVYSLKFGCIIEEAKRQGLISRKLETKINKIRNLRNIVAHYSQRVKGIFPKTSDYNRELALSIKRRRWANEKTAYDTLVETAKTIRIIINKAYSLISKSIKER